MWRVPPPERRGVTLSGARAPRGQLKYIPNTKIPLILYQVLCTLYRIFIARGGREARYMENSPWLL